jgi:hypothetical protein
VGSAAARGRREPHRVRPPSGGVRCWRSNSRHALPALMPALSYGVHDPRERSHPGRFQDQARLKVAALRSREIVAFPAVDGALMVGPRDITRLAWSRSRHCPEGSGVPRGTPLVPGHAASSFGRLTATE